MTIPNCISLFRIFLVPCFAWVFLTASLPEDFTLAAVLLVVSAVSDLLDGWIARRFHMTSKLGKILDPAADKLTLFGVFVCMWARYPGFWPLYSLFIAKELLMAAASVLILRRNHEIEASHWFGKLYNAGLLCGVGDLCTGYPPGVPAASGTLVGYESLYHWLFRCSISRYLSGSGSHRTTRNRLDRAEISTLGMSVTTI